MVRGVWQLFRLGAAGDRGIGGSGKSVRPIVVRVGRVTSPVCCPGPPVGCRWQGPISGYRFSAFWLRSSVVSVLISLISDTSPIRGLHIKRIFGTGSRRRSFSIRSEHRPGIAVLSGTVHPFKICAKKGLSRVVCVCERET